MALDIDAFGAAAALAGTDKIGVAQGDAVMKRALLSALLTYISANIGTTFTRTILDDVAAGNVLTTLGISAFVQTLFDDTDAQAARATLGVEVVDSVFASYVTNTNITAVIPLDDTIPQIGEGIEILSVSITPKSTSNKLRATYRGNGATAGTTSFLVSALFAAGGANALVAAANQHAAADRTTEAALAWEWVPGVTTAVTVAVRVGPGTTGTIRMNGSSTGRLFGGASACTLVVEEILA